MKVIPTNVPCVVSSCAKAGGMVMAEVDEETLTPPTSFFCQKCGICYHHPPDKPNAAQEIARELFREYMNEQRVLIQRASSIRIARLCAGATS